MPPLGSPQKLQLPLGKKDATFETKPFSNILRKGSNYDVIKSAFLDTLRTASWIALLLEFNRDARRKVGLEENCGTL